MKFYLWPECDCPAKCKWKGFHKFYLQYYCRCCNMNVSKATRGQLRYALYERNPRCVDKVAKDKYLALNSQYQLERKQQSVEEMRATLAMEPGIDPTNWGPKKVQMRFNDLSKPNLACKIGIAHLRGCAAARSLNIVDYNPDKEVDKSAV